MSSMPGGGSISTKLKYRRTEITNLPIQNKVLLALPAHLRDEILLNSKVVELSFGDNLSEVEEQGEYIYFINSGFVALVKTMTDGRSVEVGIVGVEGLVGLFGLFEFERTLVSYVAQVPTKAFRIPSRVFKTIIHDSAILETLIRKLKFLVMKQLIQNSACNRLHTLEQRFCTWLLIARDNVFCDAFPLTHDFLSTILGVQRPSLSVAANKLQKLNAVRYSHGHIAIIDRAAIEVSACECYATLTSQIEQTFAGGF
jgi:CRP-like cAMP-binding protein